MAISRNYVLDDKGDESGSSVLVLIFDNSYPCFDQRFNGYAFQEL